MGMFRHWNADLTIGILGLAAIAVAVIWPEYEPVIFLAIVVYLVAVALAAAIRHVLMGR